MKKLLAIFAISTITIVPSVTIVSCFNNTHLNKITFDKKDPIGSINKAIENRELKLSEDDFKTTNTEVTSPIVYEISNLFTDLEDIQAARKWLLLSDNVSVKLSAEPKAGEVLSVNIFDGTTQNETFVKFKVQEGNSFNWLKNQDSQTQATYFLIKGDIENAKTDFSWENNKDSIKVLPYLADTFNKYKNDGSESGQALKESAAMQIYSSLIMQTIAKVKSESELGWEEFNKLNTSSVIFNEDTDSEVVRHFTKGSPSSIADFITLVIQEQNKDKTHIVEFVDNLLTTLENGSSKNGVKIKTNFFNFELDNSNTKDTEGWYTFKVTKQ